MRSPFQSIRESLRRTFESFDKTFDEAEAAFHEVDAEAAGVEANTEKKTVTEETRPDGSRVVTTTTIRKIVKKT